MLDEFSRPGSLLEPDDIYDYSLHRILAESSARVPVLAWAKEILAGDAAPGRKVFAMVLLGQTKQAIGQGIERYLDDANPVLRRAAFRALVVLDVIPESGTPSYEQRRATATRRARFRAGL